MQLLRIRWFDPIAEVSELANHSRSVPLLGLFGDGWPLFFVTDALMQDQPDQARDRAAIDDVEDGSFGLDCGVGSLIE